MSGGSWLARSKSRLKSYHSSCHENREKLKELQYTIKLLESPIPPAATPTPSQKAHFDNISGTKRGSIDPLVSKRPEKNSE